MKICVWFFRLALRGWLAFHAQTDFFDEPKCVERGITPTFQHAAPRLQTRKPRETRTDKLRSVKLILTHSLYLWKVEEHNFHLVLIRGKKIKISRRTVSLGPHSVRKFSISKIFIFIQFSMKIFRSKKSKIQKIIFSKIFEIEKNRKFFIENWMKMKNFEINIFRFLRFFQLDFQWKFQWKFSDFLDLKIFRDSTFTNFIFRSTQPFRPKFCAKLCRIPRRRPWNQNPRE